METSITGIYAVGDIRSKKVSQIDVAFVISILVGLWVAVKRVPSLGVKPDHIMDLTVIIIISAIIGSRIWYVVYNTEEFKGHWIDTVNPFQNGYIGIAGLSMVGGIVLWTEKSLLQSETVLRKIIRRMRRFSKCLGLMKKVVRLAAFA